MRAIPTALMLTLLTAACASKEPARKGSFERLDVDTDGYLNADEYSVDPMSEVLTFDELDADGDKLISEKEFSIGIQERRREGRRERSGRRRNQY